jgi:hypothetical protein
MRVHTVVDWLTLAEHMQSVMFSHAAAKASLESGVSTISQARVAHTDRKCAVACSVCEYYK